MYKATLVISLFLCMAILTGCSGTMMIIPPENRTVQRAYSFETTYDNTWLLAVDWFAENNITIDKIEKDSGLITAKYNLQLNDNALDCGEVSTSTLATLQFYEETANVNVTIRKIDAKNTKVSINISGSYRGMGHDNGWGKKLPFSGHCVSTGMLEKSVATFISSRI